MGKKLRVKKGKCGNATTYISRRRALTKLQLSLKDFRRLCILKGIYPVEPPNRKKLNINNSRNTTYYLVKDVIYLSHEPLVDKFRQFKIFLRRLKKAIGKGDRYDSDRLRENMPFFKLDHIVKERYPTFVDALRDLDDAISMCFLFSTFPKMNVVKSELIHLCRRLTVEFLHYVIESRSLRKVFISIKGFYYQAEIMGQTITWIIPHSVGFQPPTDVDFKIMVTFTEFYSTLLGFVNFKLFNSINIIYPPKLSVGDMEHVEDEFPDEESGQYVPSLNHSLKTSLNDVVDDDGEPDEFESDGTDEEARKAEEKISKQKKLFENCKIYLNREVPRESLVFIIRCFGGEVSFDKTVFIGATFEESDETITHHIIDRPMLTKNYLSRFYVQPQWVYDSVNAAMLLPVEMYFPGTTLPPHLSPFVEEREGDYIPPERQALLDYQEGKTKLLRCVEDDSDEDEFSDQDMVEINESGDMDVKDEVSEEPETEPVKKDKVSKMKVLTGKQRKQVDPARLAQLQEAEEKRLAIMMMPKKDKYLYKKMMFGQKRKNREAQKLKEKREQFEKSQKKAPGNKIKRQKTS